MNKNDLKYDPDLRYAIVNGPHLWARFAYQGDALAYVEREGGEVVDTRPRKVPADAQYLVIHLSDGPYYLKREGDGSWKDASASTFLSRDHLESFIRVSGDPEVTVLVPKEDA